MVTFFCLIFGKSMVENTREHIDKNAVARYDFEGSIFCK